MSIGESLLPEFDHEMANTRKVLERIPADRLDWKAHPRSNTLGWVAAHLANLPYFVVKTFQGESLDIAPPGGEPYRTPPATSVAEVLASFDRNVAAARAAIAAASDDDFRQTWTLLRAGQPLFALPRTAVLRSFVLNHMIHHRGHLCVYLRLNDVPVPALYGPSGDEH